MLLPRPAKYKSPRKVLEIVRFANLDCLAVLHDRGLKYGCAVQLMHVSRYGPEKFKNTRPAWFGTDKSCCRLGPVSRWTTGWLP